MTTLKELLANLPPEPDEASLFPRLQQAVAENGRKLVVIDDDPTGTQTVHDVALFTTWDAQTLTEALIKEQHLFYLLTNSRSMPEDEAAQLNSDIGHMLLEASKAANTGFVVASRSDSTLRGHYPAEILALERGLSSTFDGHLIVPAFFEGGRYTINDTHYVASDAANQDSPLRPANETPFAQDRVFSYTTAYLPKWVEEKSDGHWKASQVVSIGLELIRQGGPEAVAETLNKVEHGVPVVVNAVGYGDLIVVVLGLLRAEAAGKRFLYRTAASFVRLRGAISTKPLLTAKEIIGNTSAATAGGVVVVGSYVPDSSKQLEKLLDMPNVKGIELAVERVIGDESESQEVSSELGRQLEAVIRTGQVGVLYTSRKLVTSEGHAENLDIGKRVSQALITAFHELSSRPRFVIAKGGITSHDIAQKGLGASRAYVLGQLFAGVPVWRLETGPQSRFQGVPYIVFPGNVGGPDSLAQAVNVLNDA